MPISIETTECALAALTSSSPRFRISVTRFGNCSRVRFCTLYSAALNRREACKIAGVVPETRVLNGEDPTAYVLSANIHRRHMTKGQRAMAVAMIFPKPEKGGRGKKRLGDLTVSAERLSTARTVLASAPNVFAQAPQNDAYDEALKRKKADASGEAQLADLRDRYPELADKVVEGDLTLAGARAEASVFPARFALIPGFRLSGPLRARQERDLALRVLGAVRGPRCACTGVSCRWRVDFGGVGDPIGRACDQILLEEREIRLERPHFDLMPSCLPRGFCVTTVMSAVGGKADIDFGRLEVCF